MLRSLLGFVLALLAASSHAELRGRIVTESGDPIVGVSVVAVRDGESDYLAKNETITNKSGRFNLKGQFQLLLTQRPGFIPDFHLLAVGENDVLLTLKPSDAEPALQFPGCPWPAGDIRGNPVGFEHRVIIPDNVPVRWKQGIDTNQSVVSFPGHENETMTIWTGMYAFEQPRLDALVQTLVFAA